jgi:hypothetical protein
MERLVVQLPRVRAIGVGLILAGSCSAAAVASEEPPSRPLELKLAAGTFRPLEGRPATPSWFREIAVPHSSAGRRHLVAITDAALTAEQRHDLELAGATLLGYLPVHGYRLQVSPQNEAAVRSLPFVTWLGELPAHLKISERIHERAGRPDGRPTAIRVVLAPDEPEARVVRALADLVVSAAPSGPAGAWRVEAVVPEARLHGVLSRLAAFPEVETIEEVRPVQLLNQDAVWVHQSFVSSPGSAQAPVFNRGIFGCGQVLSVADSGQDFDVCFLRDTLDPPVSTCSVAPCPAAAPDLTKRKDIRYYNWSGGVLGDDDTCPSTLFLGSGHGTHTSGSAVGDTSPFADCSGFTTPNRNGGDGQAPGAKLVMIELGDDFAYLNSMGGTIWNIADVAYQTGSRIHSFSLGGVCYDVLQQCVPGCTLPYDSLARDSDLAMWTYPDLLLVNAAGNSQGICAPPRSVVTPALAKNLVAVGAVGHGTAANTVSSTSSRGPVFDGRLKPTLAAQGESVASAASDGNPNTDNCGICSLSGTSMSSPTVAGLAALVREYYTAGFYATGSRNPGQGFTPTGALIKATLIDSAVNPASGIAAAPNFDSGFGRVKLDSTLSFTGSPFALRVVDDRTGLSTGGVVTRAYDVTAGQPFRATLVWTDYPADINAAVARVNELKLEVIDPAGNTWFQTRGTGLPSQTMNAASPHDSVNVEERLVFNSPAAGRWVVRVVGVDVAWAPQPFALVVRGAISDCPATPAPATPTLSTPADNQVLVSWTSVPGAAAYNVYRNLGACPGGAWIPIATGETGTSYLDTGVSGGAQYSYRVVATSDIDAFCESPPSGCASVVPTGDCFLLPDFDGLASVASDGSSTCSVTLDWTAATAHCSGPTRYNVYRSTAPGFTPSGANRIASCVSGTSYTDSAGLVYNTNYYYVVRAEDGTTGHGGPCGGGNEETNVVERATRPDGPPVFGTWSDNGGDTPPARFVPQSSWSLTPDKGVGGSKGYTGTSSAWLCSDLVSPALTLAGPAEGPTLTFKTHYAFDYDDGTVLAQQGSLAQVEIAIGPNFTTWDRVELTGGYPTPIDFHRNICPTTQTLRNYFTDVLGGPNNFQTFTAPLSLWAGNDVKLRFHISGDEWWPGGQMWVDDIQVTQTEVPGTCATGSGGPPPIPDGASVPGTPMRASRNGASVNLTWDTSSCPAAEVNVYFGSLGSFSTFTGGHCGLAGTGAATVSMANNTWFLVVGTDGGSTVGSWSRRSSGAELNYSGSPTACPAITQHVPGSCP